MKSDEGSAEVLSESDGSDSERGQDSDRESLGELVAINSSIPGGAEAWRCCMPPRFSPPKLYHLPPPLASSHVC